MSWILILSSRDVHRQSVVIGGYRSEAEARAAGEVAIAATVAWDAAREARDRRIIEGESAYRSANHLPASTHVFVDALYDFTDAERALHAAFNSSPWNSYAVIPGAADMGPQQP